MSPFELVFAVFGLLLGLAIAEVLGGFSRTLKLKRGSRAIKVGWLTPLLGVLVVLDLTSFWLMAWEARDQIAANYITLVYVLALVGVYYLAATLIFPDEPEEWPDFNHWYDKQNHLVIGGLLTANIGAWIGQIALEFAAPAEAAAESEAALTTTDLAYMGSALALIILLIALLRVKSRGWNIAMLSAAIVMLLTTGILDAWVVA